MLRVRSEELDYLEDGLYYYRDEPFTGVIVYHTETGGIEVEEEYQAGLLSGWEREWYSSGVLAREAQCAWGAWHGFRREWDENGQLVAEDVYEYGIRVSGRRWDSAWNLIEAFQLQESDPAFRRLQAYRAAFEHDQGTG